MAHAIEHHDNGSHGAFYIERDGQRIAEMTFSRTHPSLVVVDHTYVDPSLRGHGVARQLQDALVACARGHVQALGPLGSDQIDTVVLGCTHYPFIKPLLRSLVPESISLIDTGAAVARQLQRLLSERELLATGPAEAARFWSSGEPRLMQAVLPRLWGQAAEVQAL